MVNGKHMTAEDFLLTVEDANRRLPLVRAIVRDAMGLTSDVRFRQERLLDLRERYPENDDEGSPYSEEVLQMEESLEADEIRIDEFVTELKQVGADLVDAEAGLVEFASSMAGTPIRLSWMFDEAEIGYWRAEDAESEDRKPLEMAEQSAG